MRPERHSRGPDPAYSREQITSAAVKVADAEGIEAISIRRIAREVGAGTMSLYRYIGSKDDLIELMADAVQSEDPLEVPTGNWRADLERIAERQRAVMLRHPWLTTLSPGRPTFGPNTVRAFEDELRCVDGIGLDIDEMLTIVLSVTSFVRGFVQSVLSEAETQRRTKLTEEEWRKSHAPYLTKLIDSGEFPLFAKVITDAALPHMDPDQQFNTGLGHLLDGISARLEKRA